MSSALPQAPHFFETAVERYKIRQARAEGLEPPWTTDPVYRAWRFCNVHREDDAVTRWFRREVRNPLSELARGRQLDVVAHQNVVRATVAFRWFNRNQTGEHIKDILLSGWRPDATATDRARQRLQGVKPVVTGAYIIKGWDGYNKLDGVLKCIYNALPQLDEKLPRFSSLQAAWNELNTGIQYLGPFMSYEVVSDLRWTPVLERAPDIMTWANAGPGCARGMGWVTQNRNDVFNVGSRRDQALILELMSELLDMSTKECHWPQAWPAWEMREVEHWLCEYDKYRRVQAGSKMKRRFP